MVNLKFQVSWSSIFTVSFLKNYLSLQQGKALINERKTKKKQWTYFLQTPMCSFSLRQTKLSVPMFSLKLTFLIRTLVNMTMETFLCPESKKLMYIVNPTLRTLFIYTLSVTEYLTTKNLTETAKCFVTSCLIFSPLG